LYSILLRALHPPISKEKIVDLNLKTVHQIRALTQDNTTEHHTTPHHPTPNTVAEDDLPLVRCEVDIEGACRNSDVEDASGLMLHLIFPPYL
jgi:hypothetical protein